MKEFKSNIFIVLKNTIIYSLAMSVILLIANQALIQFKRVHLSFPVLGAIGAIGLVIVLAIVWSDWIRIVVQDGKMIIYRGKKVKNHFVVSDCKISSKITTKGFNSNCQLTIEHDSGIEWLDCSMLGTRRYKKLLEAIGFDNPIKVNVQ